MIIWDFFCHSELTNHTSTQNYEQAFHRSRMLPYRLLYYYSKCKHFVKFMQKLFDNNTEIAPPLKTNDECWYLPIFGVCHHKTVYQIRVVFDVLKVPNLKEYR